MCQVQAGEGQRVNISLYTLRTSVSRYCPLQAFFTDKRHTHTEPLCAVDNTPTTRHVFTSSGHSMDVQWSLDGLPVVTQWTSNGHSIYVQWSLDERPVVTRSTFSGHSMNVQFIVNNRLTTAHLRQTSFILQLQGHHHHHHHEFLMCSQIVYKDRRDSMNQQAR